MSATNRAVPLCVQPRPYLRLAAPPLRPPPPPLMPECCVPVLLCLPERWRRGELTRNERLRALMSPLWRLARRPTALTFAPRDPRAYLEDPRETDSSTKSCVITAALSSPCAVRPLRCDQCAWQPAGCRHPRFSAARWWWRAWCVLHVRIRAGFGARAGWWMLVSLVVFLGSPTSRCVTLTVVCALMIRHVLRGRALYYFRLVIDV